ncbi:LPP20 family lipoprotein [Nitrincola tapanii]|uniref:LPP20 family lipoprotein n=1 Tax=Nitrincola tapanii TaxID=1708751 RepID=UPI001F1A4E9D|nr:LPP20 family lipoprotein [Nitrincola tapanii]
MIKRALFVAFCALSLSGCETLAYTLENASADSAQSRPVRQVASQPQWVSATGYAPISLQPGQTEQQKILMAMRASKLQAYQELAAIINGQYLFGTSRVEDMVLQNDQFRTSVAGIVRGARVVKSYPVQSDTYATVLEVDLSQVERAWVQAR